MTHLEFGGTYSGVSRVDHVNYTFNLDKLLPGQKFRRLQATPLQDQEANDGSVVADKLTLGPKEGLFLVKSKGSGLFVESFVRESNLAASSGTHSGFQP